MDFVLAVFRHLIPEDPINDMGKGGMRDVVKQSGDLLFFTCPQSLEENHHASTVFETADVF